MPRRKGAEIMCEALLREGANILFGHPGGAILPFYDALWGYPQLRHILVRHEQCAAHAAEGFARATGQVGVCVATSGPGATNLITGLMAAKMDSVPMVAITGQVVRAMIGREAFQECPTCDIARPATKGAFLVTSAAELAPTLHHAFRLAQEGRPGPVLVDVPRDVQQEEAELHYPPVPPRRTPPLSEEARQHVAELARWIAQSQRPVLLVGRGVHIAAAQAETVALAERAAIPAVNTLHGLGAFPRRHPLSLGLGGMHGMYWSNMALDQADLVIGLGARFDDRVVGRPTSFAPRARIVHIDVDPAQFGKLIKPHLAIQGDVRAVLQALLPLLHPAQHEEWLTQIEVWKREHPSLLVPPGQALTAQFLMARLNETINRDDDVVVVTGVGQHQMWAAQFLELDRPNSFMSSGGLGVMGYEVPAAIGAQVARPRARVWSVAGDGGFQMTLQELGTIAAEKLPVKIVVVNNGFLGMVRQWQELFYQHHYKSVDIPGPDLVRLAEAYGILGLRATRRQEVADVLEKARTHPGPVLVEAVVEREENVYPMVPPGASLAETVEDPRVVQYLAAANNA